MIADYEGDITKLFEGGENGEVPVLATRNLVLFPGVVSPVLIGRTEIPGATKANAVTRAQRRRLLETLKQFRLSVVSAGPIEQAIVTSCGVSTKEIDPATMASKKLPGLYFAGEIIDVDAYTGGFNLQIAWSTGRAAGQAAAQYDVTERRGPL